MDNATTSSSLNPMRESNGSISPPPVLQREDYNSEIVFPQYSKSQSVPSSNLSNPPFLNSLFIKKREYEGYGRANPLIFHPTIEEMSDFSAYVKKIEEVYGAHTACGICKIVPPKEWTPRNFKEYSVKEIDSFIIESPIKESIHQKVGIPGVYDKLNQVYKKEMTGKEFRQLATSREYKTPQKSTIEELEKHYWKTVTIGSYIYGADTPGTLYDPSVTKFNITKLGTILDLLDQNRVYVKGINTPYLYFGMYKTTFSWHSEDCDLYSINYLHLGEPKFWYAIPPEAAESFERLAAQLFSKNSSSCKAFMRHKTCMIAPAVLDEYGIPYGTMVQYPGEFIITFPCGYHMGFNTGYNIAEAINFAVDRWMDYGKNSVACLCVKDRVKIDMKPFMKKYRPDEYDFWHRYWYEGRPFIPSNEYNRGITLTRLHELNREVPPAEAMLILKIMLRYQKALKRKELLKRLFSTKACLSNESRYNLKQGKIFPYCAICQYLVPDLNLQTDALDSFPIPKKSPRYTTNQMFTKLQEDPTSSQLYPSEDMLLQCATCKVVVHDGCYFGKFKGNASLNTEDSWKCYRCRDRSSHHIENTVCRFCYMRGGAFIPCSSGIFDKNEFAHVICAMLDRRTKIISSPHPKCISLISRRNVPVTKEWSTKLNPVESLLEIAYRERKSSYDGSSKSFACQLCGHQGEGLLTCELCNDDSPIHFHATCGKLLDVIYERRDYPLLLVPLCSAHGPDVPECVIQDPPVTKGEAVQVMVDGKMCDGIVTDIRAESFLTVDFMDSLRSDDLPPEDVCRCECNERLCDRVNHIPGSLMYINWDNNVYPTYYRGKSTEMYYKVKIDSLLEENSDSVQKTIEVQKNCLIRFILAENKTKNRKRKLS